VRSVNGVAFRLELKQPTSADTPGIQSAREDERAPKDAPVLHTTPSEIPTPSPGEGNGQRQRAT